MKKKWVVVLDFDGTLISKEYISLYNVIDQQITAPEYAKRANELRTYYMGRVFERQLTIKEQKDWFSETIKLYVDFDLTIEKIKKVMVKVKLRNGVKECLEFLKQQEIPVAIVSYGVSNFIGTVLKSNGVIHLISRVYSADLIIDRKSGVVTGFFPKTVILPCDKKVTAHKFADAYKVPHKNILGVGDSIHDAGLGDRKGNRFGISHNKESIKTLKKVMGTTMITEDFYPVIDWLRGKLGISEANEKEEHGMPCANPDCGEEKICPECGNFMPKPFKIGN